ncbi:hypothetical protein [Albibacillus kandeliae]|uniref:hypothetical protein n=1 Tax=Albibacillus kandeliae TaxID=2174228 RepID=UPI0013004629|nr:hypothetical protein [Albibacillus kandeliae]
MPIGSKSETGTLFDGRDLVYAHFGAAAFAAQVFEQNIILVLKLRGRIEDIKVAMSDEIQTFNARGQIDYRRMTLGKLVNLLRGRFYLENSVAIQFADALKLRNELMHGYFSRNAARLQTADGKNEMILELDTATETFFQAVRTAALFAIDEGGDLLRLVDSNPDLQ